MSKFREWPPRRVNYTGIIDKLGGHVKVADMIKERGWGKPSSYRVYQWRYRNRLPSEWVPFFLALALEHGVAPDLATLIGVNE